MRAFLLSVVGSGALLLSVGLMAPGCGSAETAFDCQAACSRYAACYDDDYDVGACRDRCRNAAKNDETVRNKADQCEACIGGMSCLSATFSCAGPCSAIVP